MIVQELYLYINIIAKAIYRHTYIENIKSGDYFEAPCHLSQAKVCMTKPGFVNIGGKRIRAFFDDNKQPIEVYDEDIKSYRDYRSYIEKSNRPSVEVSTMNKEGRNICGKVRTCKISGDKILEVYDDEKKVYLPYDLFMKQQEEYKTNPIVDDTTEEYKKEHKKKEERKEYYTTHGKKIKDMETGDIVPLPDNTKVSIEKREEKEEEKKEEKKFEKEEKKFEFPYLDIDYIYEMI